MKHFHRPISTYTKVKMERLSEEAKRTKVSLVRTRKDISDKFHKLHDERIDEENRLKRKYAPITDSLEKLKDVKERPISMKNENQDIDFDYNNLKSDFELEMNNFYNGGKSIKIEKDEMEYDDDANSDVLNTSHNDLMIRAVKRDNVKKLTKKKNIDDVRKSVRSKTTSARKLKRTEMVDSKRPILLVDSNIATKRKHLEISPEDYAFEGNYETLGAKRRRIDTTKKKVMLKKEVRNIDTIRNFKREKTSNGVKWDNLATDNSNKSTKNNLKRLVISPEDYDLRGNFVGLAPKRRKIELSFQESKDDLTNNKLQSKIKNIKSKTRIKSEKSGNSLEKEFIPYSQNVVYEYYDDPNELCQRLRLLLSSKSAGNSNHDQEINSIIEELRERKIIS